MSGEKTNESKRVAAGADDALPEWLELVRKQVASLKFGTVQVTVHDSHVTQVERLEKVRLDRPRQQP